MYRYLYDFVPLPWEISKNPSLPMLASGGDDVGRTEDPEDVNFCHVYTEIAFRTSFYVEYFYENGKNQQSSEFKAKTPNIIVINFKLSNFKLH